MFQWIYSVIFSKQHNDRVEQLYEDIKSIKESLQLIEQHLKNDHTNKINTANEICYLLEKISDGITTRNDRMWF